MILDTDTMTALTPAPAITVRETDSGVVILAGEQAYKIKKPVVLSFLDFRSEAARRAACEREIELNRRLAPDVYADLATFVQPDTQVHEPVIVMRRMPEQLRLSTLVRSGTEVDDRLRALARLLAGFHAGARRSPRIAEEGGAARLRYRWIAGLRESQRFCPSVFDPAVQAGIRRLALRYVDGRGALFRSRVAAGLIVDGHGDLVAEDIFCLPDYPRVLDCLEFDDRLRWVDVLDDVAVLAVDLERLGRPELARRFLDWYERFSAAPAVVSLRHHYVAYRAFTRAKASALRASQGTSQGSTEAMAEATQQAQMALTHLTCGEVRLVLVGGGIGSGKTTLAAALADRLGCVLLSSDSVRRECTGTRLTDTPAACDAVYAELLARASRALGYGESVVAEASWGEPAWRHLAAATAAETASRLVSLQCVAPDQLAAVRALRRTATGHDLSGADLPYARQSPWPEATVIDTSGDLGTALASAQRATAPDPAC